MRGCHETLHFFHHLSLIVVGITATVVLLIVTRLPVTQDVQLLLQLVWLGVTVASVFLVVVKPVTSMPSGHDSAAGSEIENIPEWADADRAWLQQHPNNGYMTDGIDREEG
jgi:hypothetical protein